MGSNGNRELEAALEKIKTAWAVGVIAVIGQIVFEVGFRMSFALYDTLASQDRFSTPQIILLIVQSIIVLSLCYGIYKRSKICAIALLVYATLTTLFGLRLGVGIALFGGLLIVAAFQGIQGISTYHRLTSQ